MSRTKSQPRTNHPDDLTRQGVLYGVGSFVAGYLLLSVLRGDQLLSDFTQGFTSTGPSLSELSQMGGSLPEKWQLTGQFYYVGHNADLSLRVAASGQEFSQSISPEFFGGQNTIIWIAPIVALVGGGFLLARQYDFTSTGEAAKAGARITAGYLPAVAIGIFAFQWTTSVESAFAAVTLTMQPDLMTSLMFAGVVYPVVLGAVGGAISHEL